MLLSIFFIVVCTLGPVYIAFYYGIPYGIAAFLIPIGIALKWSGYMSDGQ